MSNESKEGAEMIQAEHYLATSATGNYIIVWANDVRPLVGVIGDMMNKGYACQGGIAVGFAEPTKPWFYQAMTKIG